MKADAKDDSQSISVLRMGGIGDIIILSSTLRALKEKMPWRPLIFGTLPEHICILKGQPFLDEVIPIQQAEKRIVFRQIDLRWAVEPPNIGQGKIPFQLYITADRSDIFDMLIGIAEPPKKFVMTFDNIGFKKVKKLMGDDQYIGIFATSRAPVRSIPPEYVQPMADEIVKKFKTKVVIFGKTMSWNKAVKKVKGKGILNLTDQLNIEATGALVSALDAVVSSDTAAVHMAGAFQRPCLALFGNIDPCTRVSYYPTVHAIWAKHYSNLTCVPCHDIPGSCNPKEPRSACMKVFTPKIVVKELDKII
jgi:ADP-heptose:LPS heptosyltransferase